MTFIQIAYAADASAAANALLTKIKTAILYPFISLLLGVAVLMFLWGVFEMVMNAENSEARVKGRSHILFGLIGIVVMLSALAILQIAVATVGVTMPS